MQRFLERLIGPPDQQKRTRRRTIGKELEALEGRRLMSAGTSLPGDGSLLIQVHMDEPGNDLPLTAEVSLKDTKGTPDPADDHIIVTCTYNNKTTTLDFQPFSFIFIEFKGGKGGDSFKNNTPYACTAYGNEGSDTLTGGDGADWLFGGYGNDKLDGRGGSDWVEGGYGSDTLFGGGGADELYGRGKYNTADYNVNDKEEIHGGDGNDTIQGGYYADVLYGDGNNDSVLGFDGADQIYGGIGNDTLAGMGGNDTIYGDGGNDEIYGDVGNDTVYGGTGNDAISGGDGNDTLHGDDGADTLSGDWGDDYLDGGFDAYSDVLSGGIGNDTFKLNAFNSGGTYVLDQFADFNLLYGWKDKAIG